MPILYAGNEYREPEKGFDFCSWCDCEWQERDLKPDNNKGTICPNCSKDHPERVYPVLTAKDFDCNAIYL
jgi:hypothetical protein